MNLLQELHGDILVLRPVGRLDSATCVGLEVLVQERLQAGCNRLVIDLAQLEYVSSAGLRVILMAGKQLRTSKGTFVLSGLRENVREVFEMSGFLSLFPVVGGLDEAIARA